MTRSRLSTPTAPAAAPIPVPPPIIPTAVNQQGGDRSMQIEITHN
ncbi:MAG: hypothetical protein PUP92_19620 [Rhizonema sp. PD38]|nr:hypothetical protein [Rhizonema sp. PD38]